MAIALTILITGLIVFAYKKLEDLHEYVLIAQRANPDLELTRAQRLAFKLVERTR
jgi:hypothetical protein